MIGWSVNCKGYAGKPSWFNLWYYTYHSVCPEVGGGGALQNHKILIQHNRSLGQYFIFECEARMLTARPRRSVLLMSETDLSSVSHDIWTNRKLAWMLLSYLYLFLQVLSCISQYHSNLYNNWPYTFPSLHLSSLCLFLPLLFLLP
jgi:hypothetical protein